MGKTRGYERERFTSFPFYLNPTHPFSSIQYGQRVPHAFVWIKYHINAIESYVIHTTIKQNAYTSENIHYSSHLHEIYISAHPAIFDAWTSMLGLRCSESPSGMC